LRWQNKVPFVDYMDKKDTEGRRTVRAVTFTSIVEPFSGAAGGLLRATLPYALEEAA
jgi:hypothetical protein